MGIEKLGLSSPSYVTNIVGLYATGLTSDAIADDLYRPRPMPIDDKPIT